MKTFNDWLPILLVSILLAGCSKNSEEEPTLPPSKYITVNTGILTRVTDDGKAFTAGDNLSLFGWTGDKDYPTTDNLVVNGIKNTTSDGSLWTPESPMLWKDTSTPHYFAAISPARSLVSFTAEKIVLQGIPAKDDIMTAVNQDGKTAKDGPVSLKFSHLMTRVIVALTYKNEFGYDDKGHPLIPELTHATINVANTTLLNVLTQSATLKPGVAAAPMDLARMEENTKYQLITVPQSIPAASSFISLKVKGSDKEYIYHPTETITLNAGESTIINLTVGRDAIYFGSISVKGWDETKELEGEAV